MSVLPETPVIKSEGTRLRSPDFGLSGSQSPLSHEIGTAVSPSERGGTPSSTSSTLSESTAATSVSSISEETKRSVVKKPVAVTASLPTPMANGSGTKVLKKRPKLAATTGISTSVPVTGERPKPGQHSTLDDDVLYAIFEILFEKDPKTEGMTVKQLCDILSEKHPEMAKLSTKTSNLVSAKLNAYVKRVEKGERGLIYALSRDWADASPKRMVYVYRGILAPEYYVHVESILETQRSLDISVGDDRAKKTVGSSSAFESSSDSPVFPTVTKQRRATVFDLPTNKSASFVDELKSPAISVPYNVAPVTAALSRVPVDRASAESSPASKRRPSESEIDDDEDFETEARRLTKRSKSFSFLNSKRPKHVTAAAAAPRFSRKDLVNNPSSMAAAAALRAASFSESSIPAESQIPAKKRSKSGTALSVAWIRTLRSGFLTEDIESPEDMSISELDSMFV
ncbi:hypothetical protein PP7435_CHR1-0831 [Komagataella phaffii CBS 7435]|uniref:GDS1 winged helix domain-containing protein n=2 Tax=Komagataella phaffii TaxID=460519 RepID=C4QXB4_KOMPG|nr:uncharacterized protein PAS_chr1-4_0057 [Komagataella phaffii GS115]AOA60617.1 GQ67_02130T0 [Komagataella phaffii]CAH2446698.1 hypothetical protein BQ9382_C1-4365 [Komagataella phaffii CBS 7435]AOA66055.1 GQ68_02145T0 [Komagataella phaffii GS115]CAY67887.1 Protein of unknown function, required for growth on glycerol as a carbon source [Komagataella phaffii GS115]CCA36969.1 hypothetical protein PP7435_CHR1-0831 [Komagataella phaffii CBS 7435]